MEQKFLTIDTTAGATPQPTGKILTIYDDSHPALKLRAFPFLFNEQNDPEVNFMAPFYNDAKKLALDLLATMKKFNGLGLAAPQCGIPLRVFALSSDVVMFNPVIVSVDGADVRLKEGCLSFPGLLLPVTRKETVTVRWQDAEQQTFEQTFSGLTARVILHEYDHLDGIVFTEKVGSLTLQMAKKKKKKLVKKIQRFQESLQNKIQKTLSIKTKA